MRLRVSLVVVVALWAGSLATAQSSSEIPVLYVPDGQLDGGPFLVYVTTYLTRDNDPKLTLDIAATLTTQADRAEGASLMEVFPDQTWTEEVAGQTVRRTGTLLLFDVHKALSMGTFRAVRSISPTLTWTDYSGKTERAYSARTPAPLYFGHLHAAYLWTAFIIVGVIGLIALAARLAHPRRSLADLVRSGPYLSLSKLQVVAWTVAIGGMVAIFGFVRRDVPSIPDSLLWLMGMSLGTGGLSYVITEKIKAESAKTAGGKAPEAAIRDSKSVTLWDQLVDLITDFDKDGQAVGLAVSRAQMLFWTVLMVVLFLVKSALDGRLWPVPEQMVILMGLGQAGYLLGRGGPLFNKTEPKTVSGST